MIKTILKFCLIATMFYGTTAFSQENDTIYQENDSVNNPLYLNGYGLRPVLLKKNQFLLQLGIVSPNYYKWYNSMSGNIEALSPKMVISNTYFSGQINYGLSDKFNVRLVLPVSDLHYYSPMGISKGIGLDDIKAGIDWSPFSSNQKGKTNYSLGFTMGFPTGKHYNLEQGKLPLGNGAFELKGNFTGLYQASSFNIIYSAYYSYLTNHKSITKGDETGAFMVFQKPLNTKVGKFGVETSLFGYYKNADKQNTVEIPNTLNYGVDLGVGAWFNYLKNLRLRFYVPYSVYQNKAWLTKYEVNLEISYQF